MSSFHFSSVTSTIHSSDTYSDRVYTCDCYLRLLLTTSSTSASSESVRKDCAIWHEVTKPLLNVRHFVFLVWYYSHTTRWIFSPCFCDLSIHTHTLSLAFSSPPPHTHIHIPLSTHQWYSLDTPTTKYPHGNNQHNETRAPSPNLCHSQDIDTHALSYL